MIQRHHVSPAEATALREWSCGFVGSPYGEGYGRYLGEVERLLPGLPATIRDLLTGFRARLGQAGALLLSGLPVPEPLPPTPTRAFMDIREPLGVESMLLGIGRLLGDPVGFPDWHGGDRLQNMYPLPGESAKQNASNAVYLEMHTETAFRPDTPHVVVLLALRGDAQVPTLLCDAVQALAELSSTDRVRLAEPRYAFPLPGGGTTEPKPVVAATVRGVRINFAEALIGVDPAAVQTLAALQSAIARHLAGITLVPGDAVVVDNLHMVHGRAAYRPRYDGGDRWLQRCLVRSTNVSTDSSKADQAQGPARARPADDAPTGPSPTDRVMAATPKWSTRDPGVPQRGRSRDG